jgi:hypothetical protein
VADKANKIMSGCQPYQMVKMTEPSGNIPVPNINGSNVTLDPDVGDTGGP